MSHLNIEIKLRKMHFSEVKYLHILENFDLELLLSYNQKYVHIPSGSYIVFEFEDGLKDFDDSPDLIIQSCTICGCGHNDIDHAKISVSKNNINYTELSTIKNPDKLEIDFKDYDLDEVSFVKIEGLTAFEHPYGYGLMNIYGFSEKPKKLIAPIVSDIEYVEKGNKIIVIQDMFFEFNDSLIRKENISRIDSICSILNNQEFDSILISGHTDSIGDADYNLKLSKARANSIAYYLIDCGIRMDKLNVIGYGETRLLDNFDGDDSRNRRVEIEIFNNE
jgi:outer membrane protein OmpA-like peptidoglycan-associated protein